ncbi:MAG: hypothetical protein J6W46_02145, partial [Spirochaetaceae bacterium]|nr:hypothetical protein [Spirochaetaceae bacterium]
FKARIDDAVRHILRFKIRRNVLELKPLEDGSGYIVVLVQLNSAAESLEAFNAAKEEADKIYAEHVK